MEQKVNPEAAEGLTLGDLREWHLVTAVCPRCHHREPLPPVTLTWRRPAETLLRSLAPKLRCARCGNRTGNTLEVQVMARN